MTKRARSDWPWWVISLGVVFIVALGLAFALGLDYVVFLIYGHFAQRFHWYPLTFWEIVGAMFVLGVITSGIRHVSSSE